MDEQFKKPKTYDVDEAAVANAHPKLRRTHWSLSGTRLTPELREAWNLPSEEQAHAWQAIRDLLLKNKSFVDQHARNPDKEREHLTADEYERLHEYKDFAAAPVNGVRIPYTHHDYNVAGGYLVPYYSPPKKTLDNRSEGRIINRSRSWILNAEPQLSINRSEDEISQLYLRFVEESRDLSTLDANGMNEKCAEFRQLFGAIMTRFEQLGRAIEQGNTYGTTITFPQGRVDTAQQRPLFDLQPNEEKLQDAITLTPEQTQHLREEYTRYYRMLSKEGFLPLLRLVRLTDMKIDYDGVLIDWLREIGKPLRVKEVAQEYANDTNIVSKIGDAMKSIDQIHDLMKKAMTEGKSGEMFQQVAESFIATHGKAYGLKSPDDILKNLDDYAALCRARCGIKAEDAVGFDAIYPKMSALEDFFNSAGGFLQTVRRENHQGDTPKRRTKANAEEELNEMRQLSSLRSLLTRGTKLMTRTSYTRIPCNASAPEVWIPNFASDDPIEAHMANNLLSETEKRHVKRSMSAAEGLLESDQQRFLRAKLCSVGQLEAGFRALEERLELKQQSVSR